MKKNIIKTFTGSDDPVENEKIMREMVDFIKAYQNEQNPRRPLEETEWIYCLVGNIVPAHFYGENKEIKRGTNLFAANAKLYVFPRIGNWKHQHIRVVGIAKKDRKLIKARTKVSLITNWRLQKVYKKKVIEFMFNDNGWRDTEIDKNAILSMLPWLSELTEKDLPALD